MTTKTQTATTRAKATVAKKVPSKRVRNAALNAKAKADRALAAKKAKLAAARAAHEAGKAKALTDKRTKSLADIRKEAKGALHNLRAAAIDTATKGKRTGYAYAAALTASFGVGWWNYTKAEKGTSNHGVTVAAFFAEKDSYFAAFRANHDGVGEANPSVYWANLKKYAQTLMLDGVPKKRGAGNSLPAIDALKRDIPALYKRANKAEGFNDNETLQKAAALLGEAIKVLGLNLSKINAEGGF